MKKIILVVAATFTLMPLVYTVGNAFMGSSELQYYYGSLWGEGQRYLSFHLLPQQISLEGFYTVLLSTPRYLVKFWNSFGMTVCIVAGQLVVSVLAGYGFSRFRFPGRAPLFVLVIIVMLLPYQVTLVSNYIILDKLHLIGSYGAVVLPGIFSAFGVFLIKQTMDGIPGEVFEAASLDGAGVCRTLLYIGIPAGRGGIVTLLLLSFIDNWNMVEQPVVFLDDARMYPLSVFLAQSAQQTGTAGFACGVLALLPVMLLYMGFQDELSGGLMLTEGQKE